MILSVLARPLSSCSTPGLRQGVGRESDVRDSKTRLEQRVSTDETRQIDGWMRAAIRRTILSVNDACFTPSVLLPHPEAITAMAGDVLQMLQSRRRSSCKQPELRRQSNGEHDRRPGSLRRQPRSVDFAASASGPGSVASVVPGVLACAGGARLAIIDRN